MAMIAETGLHPAAPPVGQPSGGVANLTTVSSGGILIVQNGGNASGTTVLAGGTEIVSGGGVVVNDTVRSGGTIEFIGGISASQ